MNIDLTAIRANAHALFLGGSTDFFTGMANMSAELLNSTGVEGLLNQLAPEILELQCVGFCAAFRLSQTTPHMGFLRMLSKRNHYLNGVSRTLAGLLLIEIEEQDREVRLTRFDAFSAEVLQNLKSHQYDGRVSNEETLLIKNLLEVGGQWFSYREYETISQRGLPVVSW